MNTQILLTLGVVACVLVLFVGMSYGRRSDQYSDTQLDVHFQGPGERLEPGAIWYTGLRPWRRCKERVQHAAGYSGRCELERHSISNYHALERGMEVVRFKYAPRGRDLPDRTTA